MIISALKEVDNVIHGGFTMEFLEFIRMNRSRVFQGIL
jgi:hypothetical protein